MFEYCCTRPHEMVRHAHRNLGHQHEHGVCLHEAWQGDAATRLRGYAAGCLGVICRRLLQRIATYCHAGQHRPAADGAGGGPDRSCSRWWVLKMRIPMDIPEWIEWFNMAVECGTMMINILGVLDFTSPYGSFMIILQFILAGKQLHLGD